MSETVQEAAIHEIAPETAAEPSETPEVGQDLPQGVEVLSESQEAAKTGIHVVPLKVETVVTGRLWEVKDVRNERVATIEHLLGNNGGTFQVRMHFAAGPARTTVPQTAMNDGHLRAFSVVHKAWRSHILMLASWLNSRIEFRKVETPDTEQAENPQP